MSIYFTSTDIIGDHLQQRIDCCEFYMLPHVINDERDIQFIDGFNLTYQILLEIDNNEDQIEEILEICDSIGMRLTCLN